MRFGKKYLVINCLTGLYVPKNLEVEYLDSLEDHPDHGNLLDPGYQPNQPVQFSQVSHTHLAYQVNPFQVIQFHLLAPSALAALKTIYVTVETIVGTFTNINCHQFIHFNI